MKIANRSYANEKTEHMIKELISILYKMDYELDSIAYQTNKSRGFPVRDAIMALEAKL